MYLVLLITVIIHKMLYLSIDVLVLGVFSGKMQ